MNTGGDADEGQMLTVPTRDIRSSRDSAVSDGVYAVLWMANCDITGSGIVWPYISFQPRFPLPSTGGAFLCLVYRGYRDLLSFTISDFSIGEPLGQV